MISNVDEGKFLRIFIIGTICYIILHAFLYSRYNENIGFITNYRSYLYYLWAADIALTGVLVKFFGSSSSSDNNDGGDSDSDGDDEELMNKVTQKLEKMSKPSGESPFLSKDQLSQYNNPKHALQQQQQQEHERLQQQYLMHQQMLQKQMMEQRMMQQQQAQLAQNNHKGDQDQHSQKIMDDLSIGQKLESPKKTDSQEIVPVEQYSDTDIPMYTKN